MTTVLIRCFDCHRRVVKTEPLWMFGEPYGPSCGAKLGLRPEKRIRARKPKTNPVGEHQPVLFHLPDEEIEINEEEVKWQR